MSAGRKTFTHSGGVVSQFDEIPNKLLFVWLVCLNERKGGGGGGYVRIFSAD